MKFDVIVGNPPFKTLAENGRQTNKSIWKAFLLRSADLVKEDGYIAMVHPLGWGAPSDNAKLNDNFFTKLDLQYTKTSSSLKEHFPKVSSTFSYTITKNQPYSLNTVVEFDEGQCTIDFSKTRLVTSTGMGIIKKITDHDNPCTFKLAGKGDQYIGLGYRYDEKPIEATFKNIHHVNSSKDFEPGTDIPVRYSVFSSEWHSYPKVVIPYNGPPKPIIDSGNYGIGWCQFMIIEPNEIEGSESIFKSKVFRFFASQKHTQYNETKNLNLFPKLNLKVVWTDESLYNHFDLTKDEIAYIENRIT